MSLFFVRGQAKFEQKCFVFHWHLLRSVALFDFVIFFRELCQVVFTTSVVWKRAFTTFVETTCASKKIAKAPLPRSSNWKRKIVCENKFVRGKTQRHTSMVSEHWTLTDCKQAQFAVWNTCLPNVCLKILMFVAFAKMKNLSAETFCKSYYLVRANWACLVL